MPSYEEEISLKIERILNEIKTGQLKIGTQVYCTEIMHNVIILELPKYEIIEDYFKRKNQNKFAPFRERIKYKTKGRGKIGYASVSTIVRIQEKNFSLEFTISKELHRSSNFSDRISEAKNVGLTVKREVDPNNYYYTIYGETQNSLYDAFSGNFSLLENVSWFKHQNGEKIDIEFIGKK